METQHHWGHGSMNDRIDYLRERAHKLALVPGVYLMKDKTGKIIYVGKAKALKNRVSSYFRENANHDAKVSKMVSNVHDFDFIVTTSEFEALVLECSLIKQYDPKYNILLKDDKGYHYIGVSGGDYPRITAEKQKNDPDTTYIGPFTSSFAVKQAVEEVNKVFMLPTCKRRFPQEIGKGRPCLNYHIRQCIGVCRGSISPADYKALVDEAITYLKSGSGASVERLTVDMEDASEALDFERAAAIRDRIAAIRKIADTQRVISDSDADFDLIALAQNGEQACAAVIKYRGGRLVDKDDFFLGEDYEHQSLRADFILRYYANRSGEDIPREGLADDDLEDGALIEQYLRERAGHAVTLVVPKRGERLKLIMMGKSNASEYLSQRVGRTGREIAALDELAKLLGLPKTPAYIEAYDISNLGAADMVGAMVVFENGRPLRKAYKRFSIKTVAGQDDYASMTEVLRRRFTRYMEGDGDEGFARLPDLILLDGGKGHVGVIEPLLQDLGVAVPLFGMVKDDRHRTRAVTSSGAEIAISSYRSAFTLVTRIQDEVHRFAITYQHKVHSKRSYELTLTRVEGIGDKRAMQLMQAFKTKAALKAADADALRKAAKISGEKAEELHAFIQQNL